LRNGKNRLLFFEGSGVKAKQQKKTPAGKCLLLRGVLFSLCIMVKATSTKKETLVWPAHGLARNFPTKLPYE